MGPLNDDFALENTKNYLKNTEDIEAKALNNTSKPSKSDISYDFLTMGPLNGDFGRKTTKNYTKNTENVGPGSEIRPKATQNTAPECI